MIAKKNSGFDLEKKRAVLLQVGLLAVGSLTLAAFTYKNPSLIDSEKDMVSHQPINYQMDLQEKPEPIKRELPQQTQQNNQDQGQNQNATDMNAAVNENTKSTSNTNTNVDSKVGLDGLGYTFGDLNYDREVTGEIVPFPDTDALYIGGFGEMQNFISSTVIYPEESIQWGDQGTVFVSFIVEKDGSVSNVEIERGITTELDREAKRVVGLFPNWKPGEVQAKPVRTRVRLPITFTYGE